MTFGHEVGSAFNGDQRASHPPPFVFLDDAARPYKAMRWGGEWWLFYWHEGQKNWVSLRKAEGAELRPLRERALPADQARMYDDLAARRS